MERRFNAYLQHYLLNAKKQDKVNYLEYGARGFLGKELPELRNLNTVHDGIEDFYNNISDGYEFEWWADREDGIGGKLEFASTEYLFDDPGLYDEGDDEDLQYFRPLDYPTPETYAGFIIKPDTIYPSLFYMSVSDYQLYNLDLDYEGYTQMALDARVFNHWQKVLLYYMGDVDTGRSETETFKTDMPKIFPDWTWENFIARFESLRLSKRA